MKKIKPSGYKKEEPKADGIEPMMGKSMADTIENSFLNNISSSIPKGLNLKTDMPQKAIIKRESKRESKNYNSEKMLLSLYDAHDQLINLFEKFDINDSQSKIIADIVSNISNCISMAGGSVEKFDPLDHVSGLSAPSSNRNIKINL
jgi:hypothetical protein